MGALAKGLLASEPVRGIKNRTGFPTLTCQAHRSAPYSDPSRPLDRLRVGFRLVASAGWAVWRRGASVARARGRLTRTRMKYGKNEQSLPGRFARFRSYGLPT